MGSCEANKWVLRGQAPYVGTIGANAGGMQVLLCIISIMHTSLIINRILYLRDKPMSMSIPVCFASLLQNQI